MLGLLALLVFASMYTAWDSLANKIRATFPVLIPVALLLLGLLVYLAWRRRKRAREVYEAYTLIQ